MDRDVLHELKRQRAIAIEVQQGLEHLVRLASTASAALSLVVDGLTATCTRVEAITRD